MTARDAAPTTSTARRSPRRLAPGGAPADGRAAAPSRRSTPLRHDRRGDGPRAARHRDADASQVADTDALSTATQDALQITRSLGGYVVIVSVRRRHETTGPPSLTLRVPVGECVQDAIARLSALGTIVSQQVQIDDLQEALDALDRA